MDNPKLYPLTPSQLSIFLAWKYSFHKNVMNVPTSFFTSAELDLDLLKKAAAEGIRRNDAFAIRLTKSGKDRMQYFAEPAVSSLEIVDFSGQSPERMEQFFNKVGRIPMPLDNKPLAKIYIVRAPDRRCGMFMVVSHLILDSWAISMFYKDVCAVYFAMKNGTPMPKNPASCRSTLEKDTAYLASPRHAADEAFWKQELAGQGKLPISTHVNGPAVLERHRKKLKKPDYPYIPSFYLRSTASHEVIMIDKSDVDAMKDFCLTNQIPTMQVVFLMGMRMALSRLNNREKDVAVFNTVARRGTIEEKTSGGTRIHFVTFRTIMEEAQTFKDGVDQMMEKQSSLYRHVDYSPLEAFNLEYQHIPGRKAGEDFRGGALTFQPVPMEIKGLADVTTRWYCNGAAGQLFYLTIMDGDGTGALRCYYEYLNKQLSAEIVRRFHQHMMTVIRAGLANPQITLKELLDLPLAAR